MRSLGPLHLFVALLALVSGAAVLLRPKGDRLHRQAGWLYAASMLVLNLTALSIYRLTGRFGPFHIAALVSLATLAGGIIPVVRRRPANWIVHHYFFMTWSYVGLCAAAVSETASRLAIVREIARVTGMPMTAFWTAVAVATALVVGTGATLIRRRAPAILGRFGATMT